MKKDLLVPDIGDFENVEIIELLVKKGQKISINDPIVTLESDKSSVEVPSTHEGIVEKINLKVGDMLVYSGCDLEHWREPFKGDNCAQVFLHYNNIDGPFGTKNKFDHRPLLGISK